MAALTGTWALLFYMLETVVVNDYLFLNADKLSLIVNNQTFSWIEKYNR